MKKFIIVIAVLMLCTCIVFVGCKDPKTSNSNTESKFKILTDSIVKNGEEDLNSNCYSVTVGRDQGFTTNLYYYTTDNSVQLVANDSSSKVHLNIYINKKLSGKYDWSFTYDLYGHVCLGGTFYADRATASDVGQAFVEDISKRSGQTTTENVGPALDVVKSMGTLAINNFRKYIANKTDLTVSDFGYKY